MSRTYPASATPFDRRLIAEAGGDIDRACRLLSGYREGFDGERVIEAEAHLGLRRRLGFPTAEAERRVREAHEAEERMIAEYLARHG